MSQTLARTLVFFTSAAVLVIEILAGRLLADQHQPPGGAVAHSRDERVRSAGQPVDQQGLVGLGVGERRRAGDPPDAGRVRED